MVELGGTAAQALRRAPTGVVAVRPDDAVLAALDAMASRDIGAVVVMEGDRPVGILSERDCARKLELQGRSARETSVREIMTPQVVAVPPGATLAACSALMHEHRVRHLPVVEDGRVVGVLSSRDILEEVAAQSARHIRDLETQRLMINTGSY